MSAPNPILTTIIFVFALQAILLSALLLFSKPRTQAKIFLALLVFFFALMAFNIALVNVLASYDLMYVFRYVQLELLFGIGPALYFYTKSITDPEFRFSRKDLLHFIPVVLEFFFYRTAFYRLGASGMYLESSHPYTPLYLAEQWLGIFSITVYTLLSLRLLFTYQHSLRQHYSELENRSLNWLKIPVIIFALFWIGWTLLTEIDRFLFDRTLREIYFLPAFTGLAVVTCWIGFKGYLMSRTQKTPLSMKKMIPEEKATDPELTRQLEVLMKEQRPYLDPELDLARLSEMLKCNQKQVSHTINQSFHKNFYEFVNGYRVEAFKERMLETDSDRLTFLGHAYECGFKSKSTFNHVFKKMTGQTPTQYVNQLEKESE
ncbi:AraC family transcriptional regulator [Robertkochia aurantiaca]|uniref:AraC family transcriptional regulator n=1 Tax=Robertkochia aurantiaca TaxID=2873700 RepID=UPI001CCA2ABC|nr:helix-turn-helix domain-containing protein [Robertkochia sp. 3YJGBD-33]